MDHYPSGYYQIRRALVREIGAPGACWDARVEACDALLTVRRDAEERAAESRHLSGDGPATGCACAGPAALPGADRAARARAEGETDHGDE
jgi:hypothetical protein